MKAKGRKRGGVDSVGAHPPRKKGSIQCLASSIKGHDLDDCWALFPDQIPKTVTKLNRQRQEGAPKAVEIEESLLKWFQAMKLN